MLKLPIFVSLLRNYCAIWTCCSRVPKTILKHPDIFIKTFVFHKERSHKHFKNIKFGGISLLNTLEDLIIV